MKRVLQLVTTAATLLTLASSTATAQGGRAPWTDYGTTLYATSSEVWIRFATADAGYFNTLMFVCTMTSSCEQFMFYNRGNRTSSPEIRINHTFTPGEEVIFKLFVAATSDVWYTGGASRNSDGAVHFATRPISENTEHATYSTLGGFEDLRGGGDHDYNDLTFEFGNVRRDGITSTPEPASLVLMGTGMAGVGGLAFRRRRRNTAV